MHHSRQKKENEIRVINKINNILDKYSSFEKNKYFLNCISCHEKYNPDKPLYNCLECGDILDVVYDFKKIRIGSLSNTEMKNIWRLRRISNLIEDRSGVWRFREFIPFLKNKNDMVTLGEGRTPLFEAPFTAKYVGINDLKLKHQGINNPTASFKDTGMSAAISKAKSMNMQAVVCASTGNTSASMAAFAKRAGILPIVIIPAGQIAYGKLSQALEFGALTMQIKGDFDEAMKLVMQVCPEINVYVVNSINPFRIEGQKTIVPELLEELDWHIPDRVVVPGGNLGHAASIAKGLSELKQLGFIDKLPKLTIVQAAGSDPLYRTITSDTPDEFISVHHPKTLATAIKIGNPISYKKALKGIVETDGWITHVTEQEIADAKAVVGRDGIGCEPASAVTVAGIRKLVEEGTDGPIDPKEKVVAILTGNLLKDPDYTVLYHTDQLSEEFELTTKITSRGKKIKSTFKNSPIQVDPTSKAIKKAIISRLKK